MPDSPGSVVEERSQVPSVPHPKSKPAMFTPAYFTPPPVLALEPVVGAVVAAEVAELAGLKTTADDAADDVAAEAEAV